MGFVLMIMPSSLFFFYLLLSPMLNYLFWFRLKMEDVCDLPFNPDEIFTVETLDDTEILIEHTLCLLILGQENPDEVITVETIF